MSAYQGLEFAAHGGTSGVSLSIYYEDDSSRCGPKAYTGLIPANQWRIISIPMSQLNPANKRINRLSIQDVSGQVATFYLDDIRFTSTTQSRVTSVTRNTSPGSSDASPHKSTLHQNYPNPFNPTTTIEFSVGTRGHTSLRVFDVLGREVATLVNQEMEPGTYQAKLDGSKLISGVYISRLEFGGQHRIQKMVLTK